MNDETQNFAPDSSATQPPRTPALPQETAEIPPATGSATTELPPSPVVASSDPTATASFLAPSSPADGSPDAGTVEHVTNNSGATTAQASEAQPTKRSGPPPVPVANIAGYEILGTLGRGAMGVVYKARQRGLRRVVALKMILAGDHADERELARFQSEAEAVSQLQHPNIVQLYEVGEHEGKPFFSLEFVSGGSLAGKLNGEPQPPKKAAAILRTLAQAMGYAHLHGVIHRDLKPANVLLTEDGLPKVTDFGLAKRVEDGSAFTQDGTILGTPSYMAPEQAEGRINEINALSDVYSLGAMLYEMLTGRPPFKGTSIWETVELVRTKEPVPPSQLQPGVPRDLETICLKCLQKDPVKRYGSADELADDLERFLTGEAIRARPVSSGERLLRWCRRNPRLAALGVLAIFLVLLWAGTATGMYFQIRAEKAETEIQRKDAVDARVVAEIKKQEAIDQKNLADIRAKAAIEKSDVARDQYLSGIDSQLAIIRTISGQLQSKPGDKQNPEKAALRDQLVAIAREQMTRQAQKLQESKLSPFAMLVVSQKLGDLFRDLGDADSAAVQYAQGFDQAIELARHAFDARAGEQDPAIMPDREKELKTGIGNLSVFLNKLSDSTIETGGDMGAVAERYDKAFSLHQDVVAQILARSSGKEKDTALQEADKALVAVQWRYIEAAQLIGDPARAQGHFAKIAKYWSERAPNGRFDEWTRSWESLAQCLLGDVRSLCRDPEDARKHGAEAVRLCESLVAEVPGNDSYKFDLLSVERALGDAEFRAGNTAEAIAHYQKHLGPAEKIFEKGATPTYVRELAETYERLGQAFLRQGSSAQQSDLYFKKALVLRKRLTKQLPDLLARCVTLARGGELADAEKEANSLAQKYPRQTQVRLAVARCYAVCARRATDGKQALTQKAITRLEELVKGGYHDYVTLETDPDFDALRDEAAFHVLTAGR